ncbi:MAG: LysM peptidoglycan-binding domain-containing protein [Flavobacteriales bacterium]|nr:LysM peptidoglycan-binding domain-containing protein [Flavobacteriales bacterium]
MQLRLIIFYKCSLFLFCLALSIVSFSQNQTSKSPTSSALSLDHFPLINFNPELKSSVRAPDQWELAINVAADNKEVQSLIMTFYRDNNYAELQWLNLWHSRCADIWGEIADSFHLPMSASFIPVMLERNNLELCSCSDAGEVLKEFVGLENESTEVITKLEDVFKKSDQKNQEFMVWLHELRIIIRLLENLELPDYKDHWANNTGKRKSHTVLKGETLYRLSVLYHVQVEDIQLLNELGTSTVISEGQSLFIPVE